MSHSLGDHDESLPGASGSPKDAKSTSFSADGISGGRRSRHSSRSLRNTEVLRDSKPPAPSCSNVEIEAGALTRAHSEKLRLKKPSSKEVQRSNSHDLAPQESSRGDRTGKTNKRHSVCEARPNSVRFRRVDVDWTPGQPHGPADGAVEIAPQEIEDTSLVESLHMEIMDLRPSVHAGGMDTSFVSIMDDEHVREMFRVALNASERDERDRPADHWDFDLADPPRTAKRTASWNSCSNNSASIMARSFDSVSNLSASGRTLGSGISRDVSTGKDRAREASHKKNASYNKYVKPMLIILVLTALTASLIYFFTGGLLDEESESWTYERTNVVRNWFGEGDVGGDMVEGEGGRKTMQVVEELSSDTA
ncbi:hypothetical protein ACHAW6_007686 [Cyclotella cf. meneghiniana]